VLASEGVGDAEISLTLLDDEGIGEMNRRFLGRDRATDVIAFALGPGPCVVGDVYLGAEQARRQAADAGVSVDEELVRLAVHGTLHVLGHDHPEGEEREKSPMFTRQEALVREIGGGPARSPTAPLRHPRKRP
jgi:probable rRNA maturation factor